MNAIEHADAKRAHRLRRLAETNAKQYATDPNVLAMVVTGSVARGGVDACSDVDMIVYLREMPGEAYFENTTKQAIDSGGGFYGGDATEGFAIYRMIDGVKCDFGIGTAEQFETVIDDVLERRDLDLDKQLMIDGVRRGWTLHGHDLVNSWIEQTNAYPDALAEAMIRHHLFVRPLDVLRSMGAKRRDRLFLMEELVALQKRILGMLFGLNREYHPGKIKGSPRSFERLQRAPSDLLARFEQMFIADLDEAVDDAERIAHETWDLIDAHASHIDTAPARERFAIRLATDA